MAIYFLKIQEIEKEKQIIQEKLSELDDEISAINIDYNHNNTLLEEESFKEKFEFTFIGNIPKNINFKTNTN